MKKLLVLLAVFVFGFFAVREIYAGTPKKIAQSHSSTKSMEMPHESALSGKVVETMNGGGYTYVLIENNGVKTWAAIPQTHVLKGQTIKLMPGVEMSNFESKTLKRKFDKIMFSSGIQHSRSAFTGMKSTGGQGSEDSPMSKIKVEKAKGPNSYTIAEIYKKAGSLDRHKVVVRGKVVKVSASIMGRNWIHIQDGSGSASKGNYELVVTSTDLPKRGEIVTATGTLHKDRDFGMGYKYKAIVEKASITK